MGEIAEAMLDGTSCACCGMYLEPNEVVYIQVTNKKTKMPKNGDSYGIPVICTDCHDNNRND